MWRSSGALLLVASLLPLGSGCTNRYVEVRVHDGGRVGVGALAGRSYVPVLAPDGSEGMVSAPKAPVAVTRRGRRIAASWSGGLPIDLVNGAGAFVRTKSADGIELEGGSLNVYYNLTSKRAYSVGEHRSDALPIVLSTPTNNVIEAVEIHEPRRWPAYVFLPAGGLLTVLGAVTVASCGARECKSFGPAFLIGGIPLLVVGLVNAVQEPKVVPLRLTRAPGP